MSNFISDSTIREVLTGAIGNFLGGLLLAVLGFIVLDQTKVRPWIVSNFQPFIIEGYQKIFGFVSNKYLRIAIFIFSLWMINITINTLLFSVVAALVLFSFVFRQRYTKLSFPSSEFSDGFDKEENIKRNWIIKTGKLSLDEGKGKPRPSLKLNVSDPPEATNTFLLLKDFKSERGVIECDIWLPPGSLVNIVFLCDKDKDNWHMARFDTRGGGSSDGFLIKDQGPGVNWRGNQMSGTITNSQSFYKVRVEFSSERARMFRDGELLAEITNPQIFGSHIGIFNEVGEAIIDNFTFSSR